MYKLFFLFSFVLFILACDKKQDDFDVIDEYPTAIGTEWTYTSTSLLKIFESESSETVIDIDTVIMTIAVKIEKDTLLNDTMNVFQFISKIDEYSLVSMQYYYFDHEGFKAYAYSNSTSHSFAKKNGLKIYILDLIPSVRIGNHSSDETDIYVFKPCPRLNLKLPLGINSKWTYTFPFEPLNLQINKEVVGNETIKINNHEFSCYIVSWIYLENIFFNDTKIYDWISKEGLIKRQIIYKRGNIITADEEVIENLQLTETIMLRLAD
jgi:hypothetical protein